jgi:hypothetical protein
MNPLEQLLQMMRQSSIPMPDWQSRQTMAGAMNASGLGTGPGGNTAQYIPTGMPSDWKPIQGDQRNIFLSALPFFGAGDQPSAKEVQGADRINSYSPAGMKGKDRVVHLPNFPVAGPQQLDQTGNYRSVNQ